MASTVNPDQVIALKSSIPGIPTKMAIFFIQQRFDKSIYGINTIIKWGIWQPVKFQLVNWIKTEMIFLSYLWINVGNINLVQEETEF